MSYSLQRLSDGVGEVGRMSEARWLDGSGAMQVEQDARPRVGVSMRVGSLQARSYSAQDWWMTTPIVRILEDEPSRIVFETRSGSIYEWQCDAAAQPH
jgi:hypothetical protein